MIHIFPNIISIGIGIGIRLHTLERPWCQIILIDIHQTCETKFVVITVPIGTLFGHSRDITTEDMFTGIVFFSNTTVKVSITHQIQWPAEIFMEETAFHSPVATFNDKSTGAHIIEVKSLSLRSIRTVTYDLGDIESFPHPASGLGLLCLLILSILSIQSYCIQTNCQKNEYKSKFKSHTVSNNYTT